ncbi:hypothetical protein PR202_gn00243 [Eleusine coracana subsp. coracana]|uniref:Uncharacterized protein n=1 Tax=Eleusine coracana subsp. coracana TaxID=191504 RepID=A0AAV5G2V6_ELECO|nr:hypothetical protein PR202_gn00138 [Eleusine coracana subsp. coracana]GJN40930.1 hypothetical protein PR202_gn00243 [Eleusine coracana subsp. coracana]
MVFDRSSIPSYLQVIFRGTHWSRFWSLLQKEEQRPLMKRACRLVETAAIEIFAGNGWRFSNRITL